MSRFALKKSSGGWERALLIIEPANEQLPEFCIRPLTAGFEWNKNIKS
jgi:hypothetical protein